MVRLACCLLLFAALVAAAPPNTPWKDDGSQQVIAGQSTSNSQPVPRKLRGRFLHITDIHPDPFYKPHSDPEEQCHAGHGRAGYYGAEVTDCDTPISLVNATFQWIEANLKDEIDFVVWTGDSARHDNDERLPRSDKQVLKLNRFIVDKFVEAFGKPDNIDDPDPTNDFVVPIVPTFGNNDILPHNIFSPGPNKWTRAYLDVWDRFIPQAQRHSFARGGWFFTEVIPNKLAVFSLNTLYFFDSNSAVDGCDLKSEPGYEHMEWLRIQLQFLRNRGMKAILIGHVPPARTESKQSWDESCYQKYTLWMRQYRDVIVTSIFGHMNIDHFMFQDVNDLHYKFKIKGIDDRPGRIKRVETQPNDTFSIAAKAQYLNELRSGWSELPKPPAGHSYLCLDSAEVPNDIVDAGKKDGKKELAKFLEAIGGPWAERFSMSLVSPSVVPNFYPTLRIVEYNITGMENDHPAEGAIGDPAVEHHVDGSANEEMMSEDPEEDESNADAHPEDNIHDLKKKKKGKKRKKPKKPNFPVPKPPSKTSPPGPGYSPQSLSLLSFTQYYANLTHIHEQMQSDKSSKKDPYKHFRYLPEYTTNNDSAYRMEDLTVRSMLDLAEKMGRDSLSLSDADTEQVEKDAYTKKKGDKDKMTTRKNHLWKVFIKRAYVHTKPDDEIDQRF
ncbi:uncharacterized protein Z520_09149 [Fonsecaea multimorphosa CBS 102226]|uniref:Endopolyphosphatase n=1 Tax=Fonsecaea multimorphosa CBS 102226 TaxID=1442371 RepID=A0A0D2JPE6_9EURO|nr:uncharacterized protein Z520_09149 [Fonsecaea multimorphosa CBS 102226]KIX95232.1 hypothetical protein Z520_09149 [Fonsecaea multimorphosa CBS 102226]OAL17275.1 hypothetical protein AYO22_11840 [Fonsecaea multimorphosa]